MKKILLMSFMAAAMGWAGSIAAQAPQAEIHNAQLRVKLYLPDARNGFYRGTRFDWSGAIGDLEFAGHHLYRPWFVSVDPSVEDFKYGPNGIIASANTSMTGPAEEFQSAIGYDTAQPGGSFLKVGVGILRKSDETPYKWSKHFEIVNGGTWTTQSSASSITFKQVLSDTASGYGYEYTKTVRLVGNTGQMVIEHRLRNTGRLPIATRLYDHNFLTIDDTDVGKSYSISVPYEIHPTNKPDDKFVGIKGKTADYLADLHGEDHVAFGLQGFSDDARDYHFDVSNTAERVRVTIQGDRPLVNAVVWSIRDVMAVEPFINIQADPGKEMSWSYTYTYSTL